MAETICRTIRDGGLEGEHAPALTIKGSIASPFGFDVFNHLLTQLSNYILAGRYQSRGLVIVAFSRSPLFYVDLLKRRGIDVASSHKWCGLMYNYQRRSEMKRLRLCFLVSTKEMVNQYKYMMVENHTVRTKRIHFVSNGKLQTDEDIGKGQIIYLRDSDDEMPDSDEDPDDDLDM